MAEKHSKNDLFKFDTFYTNDIKHNAQSNWKRRSRTDLVTHLGDKLPGLSFRKRQYKLQYFIIWLK